MKKNLFLFVLLLGWASVGFAQKPDLDYPTDTIEGVIVYRYPVERSIGIYRVSVNFGVSQAMVIEWNPFLKDRGLQFGDTLYIPSGRTCVVPEAQPVIPEVQPVMPEVKPVVPDTLAVVPPTEVSFAGATNIALLLPLQAQLNKRTDAMDRFVDFYEGCLIALQQIQDSSALLQLFTYDTGKEEAVIEQLIQEGQLDSIHAIIGPVFPQQVMVLDSFIRERHIPTLIPFTDNVPTLSQNPYLIRFNATAQQEADTFLNYLRQDSAIHCILVEGRESDISKNIRYIRKQIISQDLPYTLTTLHAIMTDSLFTCLKDSVKNILIFNTEKYNNLNILLPHVQKGKRMHDLALFSQYAWQKEQVLLPQIYTTIFATDSLVSLDEYEQAYDLYFGHAHASNYPRFDVLGYDLTRQFLAFLKGQDTPQGLQSNLRLVRDGEGGWINTSITLINQ